jgi:hypothetical protein
MKNVCEKTKTVPIYAYRIKNHRGDVWRIFTFNIIGLEGKTNLIHKRIPKLEESKNGNYVMRWGDGMPLSDFISYLCK